MDRDNPTAQVAVAAAIEAGLDPQFRIVEGFERSLLYGELYDGWIEEETNGQSDAAILAESRPRLRTWRGRDCTDLAQRGAFRLVTAN